MPKNPLKNFESGQSVERKLCSFDESCSAEGFCITVTSGDTHFPCRRTDVYADSPGDPIELYHNGNLIARDLIATSPFQNSTSGVPRFADSGVPRCFSWPHPINVMT